MGDVLLEIEGASLSFGATRALDRVGLSVDRRERVAVVGPNGAGKSSLVDVISGFVPADEGRIRFDDRLVSPGSAAALARRGLRRTFQNGRLLPDRTVVENILLARIESSPRPGLGSLARASLSTPVDGSEKWGEALAMAGRFGLASVAEARAGGLDPAGRRRLELARAFFGEPKLVLLDEPTAGASRAERDELAELIIHQIDEHPSALLVVEHELDVVRRLAERVVVLSRGRVIASGSFDEILAQPEVRNIYFANASNEVRP